MCASIQLKDLNCLHWKFKPVNAAFLELQFQSKSAKKIKFRIYLHFPPKIKRAWGKTENSNRKFYALKALPNRIPRNQREVVRLYKDRHLTHKTDYTFIYFYLWSACLIVFIRRFFYCVQNKANTILFDFIGFLWLFQTVVSNK